MTTMTPEQAAWFAAELDPVPEGPVKEALAAFATALADRTV